MRGTNVWNRNEGNRRILSGDRTDSADEEGGFTSESQGRLWIFLGTAAAVGERLGALASASGRQILAVTHSPQVAAVGSQHWLVSKGGDDDAVTTRVDLLDREARREEIARMLAGAEITEEARAAAERLLDGAAPAIAASPRDAA